jgi:hypothetical protein
MTERTRFLARFIGLYCLIAALVMFMQRDAWVAAVTVAVSDPAAMLILGTVLVAAGLALVLAHNVWSGGVLPVIVTVIGWLTLAKGVMLWLLPPGVAADFYLQRLHYAQLYPVYGAVCLVIGLYLTVAGLRSGTGGR